jgi:hypothetical protein
MEKKLVLNEVVTSPSSIFSKKDVIKLIDSIDENPIKVYEMEIKEEPTVSLFDYLGYAAGPRLGKQVAEAAVRCNEKIAKKAISTRTYTGDVLLYRPQFLKEFFNSKQNLDGGDSYEVLISISDIQDYTL